MYRFALIILLLVPLIAETAAAHSTGVSFERSAGEYVIDIGYDPSVFVTDDATRFEFLLSKSGHAVDFDQVWVRIVRDKQTLLATGIVHQDLGPTTMLYVFKTPGNYTLEVSFRMDGEEDIVASFPITVTAQNADYRSFIAYALALLIGAAAGVLLVRMLHSRTS